MNITLVQGHEYEAPSEGQFHNSNNVLPDELDELLPQSKGAHCMYNF